MLRERQKLNKANIKNRRCEEKEIVKAIKTQAVRQKTNFIDLMFYVSTARTVVEVKTSSISQEESKSYL